MLRRKVLERNLDFDQALNETLRAGLSSETGRFVQKTYSCGPALVDLTKALALGDGLEDEETIRKMRYFEGR